jgi:Xaa-Pro aminopeptidase
VGYSRLEKPELRVDDDTILQEGMTFAVDGAVSLDNGVAGRVGDSVVVTKDGFEYLTVMDKSLQIL